MTQHEGFEHQGQVSAPLYVLGCVADSWRFASGDGFWREVDRITSAQDSAVPIDEIMSGKSAPRVWLILHEPGQAHLSAGVALAVARELASRDQASLVLDCDEESAALTGWADRTEKEGWIDLARYGTSVLTSGVSLPFPGRGGYLLGVGSFVPTDVTVAEIGQLVGRLRRQADDLILVAAADANGGRWAEAAAIRLLCWDRATRAASELDQFLAPLAAAGSPVTGLIGFGIEPAAVPLPEPEQSDVDPAAPADDFGAQPDTDGEAPQDVPPPDMPVLEREPQDVTVPEVAVPAAPVPAAANSGDPALDVPAEEPAFGGDAEAFDWAVDEALIEAPTRRGTSGVFWFLATASVVVVAILGAYWYKFVRVPPDGHFAAVEVSVRAKPSEAAPADRSQGDLVNLDEAAPDSLVGVESAGPAATPVEEGGPQVAAAVPAAEIETPPADRAQDPGAFSAEPYQGKVGQAGWAMHLYSFADSASAEVESAELHRRGFATEVRVVQTVENGRWWRIYVGSFASRAAADAAADALKQKLGVDWAKPTRF